MAGRVLICCSSADAGEFPLRLHEATAARRPLSSPWIDKWDTKPGRDSDGQIVETTRCADLATPRCVHAFAVPGACPLGAKF